MIDKYKVILSYQAQQNLQQQAPQQEPVAPRNQGEAAKILAQYGRKPDSPDIKQMMQIIQEEAAAGGRFGKTAAIDRSLLQRVSKKTGWPLAALMAIAMLMPQATQAGQANQMPPETRAEQGISANFKLPQAMVDKVVMLPQWVVNAAGLKGFSAAVETSMMESLKDEALLLALNKTGNVSDSLVDASWRKLQSPKLAGMVGKFMQANKIDENSMKSAIKSAVDKKLPQIQKAMAQAKNKSLERAPMAVGPQAGPQVGQA